MDEHFLVFSSSLAFFLSICAVIIAANIWGYSIGLDEIGAWLHREIYAYKNPDTGREVGVNPTHITKVFTISLEGVASCDPY